MDFDSLRIEAESLILRPPPARGFEAYAANMADAEVARFIAGQRARTVACCDLDKLRTSFEDSFFEIGIQTREQWRRHRA